MSLRLQSFSRSPLPEVIEGANTAGHLTGRFFDVLGEKPFLLVQDWQREFQHHGKIIQFYKPRSKDQ